MIPIRDHNPSGRVPFVTYTLIAMNVLVFLSYWPGAAEPQIIAFFDRFALIPAGISRGENYASFLTSAFLHGGWMHLGGNMLFLWIFGDNLEDEMGHLGFVGFYLTSAIGAALLQYITAPYSTIPMVGASGAIAGVMGGYLLLYPKARVDVLFIFLIFFRVITVPAFAMLGLWFAVQLIGGLGADATQGGVAYWAHAGGFIVGFALALPLWRRRGGADFWARTAGQPDHPPAAPLRMPSGVPKVRRRKSRSKGPWG